jgi:2-desacetyl-2-hydroxyethyl bacteriochlorophyllide A dehydrogenase
MKAVIIDRYGSPDVLKYVDIEPPSLKSDRVLVKVRASSVNPLDWKLRQGMLKVLSGNNFPLILGFDVAGDVVKVGANVKLQPGDAVYACLNSLPGGAYAEYVSVAESLLCPKPNNIAYEEAAAVPLAAMTALQALRDLGKLKAGQAILINGASGGVGTFAVQIAKNEGASVTAVCSTSNLELVRGLGADRVIDYTQEDFTQKAEKYDIIFDAVSKRSFSECQKSLKPQGVYITLLPSLDIFFNGFLTFFSPGKKAKFLPFMRANQDDLTILKGLIEAGKLRVVIDRTYPLSEVAAAHRYSETGKTKGKVVISPIV